MDRQVAKVPAALTEFPPREVRKVSYDEVSRGVEALCNLIEASLDGWKPDAIVAVVRGGLVPATHVCHFFNRPIFFINKDALLGKLEGHRRILVVDEINDTGRTFQRIREEIFNRPPNNTLDVRYAALYTRHTAQFEADYFLDYEPYFLRTQAWQQFPWERE